MVFVFKQAVKLLPLALAGMIGMSSAQAADTQDKANTTATAASATASRAPTKIKPVGKVPATQTTGAISNAGGNSQYPTGVLVPPHPPKKEGLEAAGEVKAKAAQP